MDRYNFDEQRAIFSFNNQPFCFEKFDLEKDQRYIAFMNGEDSVPNIMTIGVDEISL